jgi:hypothetical protein
MNCGGEIDAPPAAEGRGFRWVPAWVGSLSVVAALMPPGLCPACWPAYLSIASSLGLGALATKGLLGPLVWLLLAAAVGPLAFYVRKHRCWWAGVWAALGMGLVAVARWQGGPLSMSLLGASILTGAAILAIRSRSAAARPVLIHIGPRPER